MPSSNNVLRSKLTEHERELLISAFEQAGNVKNVAKLLCVDPVQVYRLLKRHGLTLSPYVRGCRRTLIPA